MDKQSNLSFALRAKYFDHQGLHTVACVTTVLVSWLLLKKRVSLTLFFNKKILLNHTLQHYNTNVT